MEYVDGQLVERHVGEWRHSRLQHLISVAFSPRERERFLTFTEQRVQVSPRPPRYRIPDVCVVELPYAPEPVLTRPPHLVVEIVSPDDSVPAMLEKVADHLKGGIPHVWIPDPYKRTLQEADREGLRPCPNLVAETYLVGRVDFAEMYGKLDRLAR
jgi:Uma2 family endonuclease